MCYLVALVGLCVNIFCAPMETKYGYKDLQWGTSLAMVKMAGYDLAPVDSDIQSSEQKNFKKDVEIYKISNNSDSAVSQVILYFSNDKLFYVMERLNKSEMKESKLAGRYGKINSKGFHKVENNLYSDAVITDGNTVTESVKVRLFSENAVAMLYDWNTFSKINKDAVRASGNATIVDDLEEIALELVKKVDSKKKSSFAFVALFSDNKDTTTENYITDALTEAVFNLNKVTIVERANLEKILSEQKFQASGLVDDSSAKDIGKIAGVDYVCYGTLKKSNDIFSVNARVVDVQSGEVFAIGRGDVKKDKYITDVETAVKVAAEKKIADEKKAVEERKKRVENSPWKVTEYRNDFDGETIYTMKCMNPNGSFLFFGYEKCDRSINSKVRCSVSWKGVSGRWSQFDFKLDSGEIVKLKGETTNDYWDNQSGCIYEKRSDSFENIYRTDVILSKQLFKMFLENNVIYLRDVSQVYPFETAGFRDVLTANGITLEEIEAAFANESF